MVFLLASNEPTLFIFLTEDKDMPALRQGLTKFVDKGMTKGGTFNKVVIGYAKDNAEIAKIMEAAGHGKALPDTMRTRDPEANEEVCNGCGGLMASSTLLAGKCIVCWRRTAMELFER